MFGPMEPAAQRRYNPLRREWVLVSPARTQRPWQGETAAPAPPAPAYAADCYLCPGNLRAQGARNPQYSGTFAFDNDYPALTVNAGDSGGQEGGIIRGMSERGRCRVLCYSPRHDLTLATLPPAEIARVVAAWQEEFATLGGEPDIGCVTIFENRGAMMGASNPHPHGQIWATEHVPSIVALEQTAQGEYATAHGSCLLCQYLEWEERGAGGERTVCANDHFVVLVPCWAVWPFETLLLPRRHVAHLGQLRGDEAEALAELLHRIAVRYDNLFETAFPYSWGFHASPTDGSRHPEWHLHAHFYPPLLRSASIRKFLVGYELLGEPQRDLSPEAAAARLRAVSERHYTVGRENS